MASLPGTTFYYRLKDASADPLAETDWTEDADGTFSGTNGETYQVVCYGRSELAEVINDTTPSVSLSALNASYGASVTVNPTYGGTNREYSLEGPPWLSINASTGQITGTAPSEDVTTTYSVTVRNSFSQATATADVTVTSAPLNAINADGWSAEQFLSGASVSETYVNREDMSSFSTTVTRPGFDASGSATTYDDDLDQTTEIRDPYDAGFAAAGDYTLDRSDVGGDIFTRAALSEFVMTADAISGFTNNSTREYADYTPQVVLMSPDNTIVGDTVDLAALVSHRFARDGRPVAAVKFILSDGVNTPLERIVSATTYKSYTASGLGAPMFETGSWDISSLDDGEITWNMIVYPWRGNVYQLSIHGKAAPNMANAPQSLWKNPTVVYAYVDSAGDNGTGVASATAGTAAANPFADYKAAAEAIATANGGSASGGVIRVTEGTTAAPATFDRVAAPTAGAPLTMESAPASDPALVIVQDPNDGSSNTMNIPTKFVVRDLTLQKTQSGTRILCDFDAQPGNSLVLENVDLDDNGQGFNQRTIFRANRLWAINSTQSGANTGAFSYFSSQAKNVNFFGCDGCFGTAVISQIACNVAVPIEISSASAKTMGQDGAIIGFNFSTWGDTSEHIKSDNDFGASTRGFAIVGNVFERTGAGNAVMTINLNNTTVKNVNIHGNTVPGNSADSGFGLVYTTQLTPSLEKEISFKGNICSRWAVKTDVFDTDATQIGNWPAVFHIGWLHNTMLEGLDASNSFEGPGSWRIETRHEGLQYGLSGSDTYADPLWTTDNSISGSSTGGGDYTPQAASPLQKIPSKAVLFSHDYNGNAVPLDGTAFVGALQRA